MINNSYYSFPIGTIIPEYPMYRLFGPSWDGPVSVKCTHRKDQWEQGPDTNLFKLFNPKNIKNRFRDLLKDSSVTELSQKIIHSDFLQTFFQNQSLSFSELTNWLKSNGYQFHARPWQTQACESLILMIQDLEGLVYKFMANINNQQATCELTHLKYLIHDIPPTCFGRSSSIAKIANVGEKILICPVGYGEHSSQKIIGNKRPEWSENVSYNEVFNLMSVQSRFTIIDPEILADQYRELQCQFPNYIRFSNKISRK